jgi:hypothetical protein
MFKRKNKNVAGDTTSRPASKGGMAKLASGIPLLLLALAAWAVTLAGVAVIRHAAGTDNVYGGLSFTWFVVFFELFVLLAALMHLIGVGVGRVPIGHAAIASLLGVVTVLTFLETNKWYLERKTAQYGTLQGNGVVTTFAGFISLSVLNGLLIIALGNQHTSAVRDNVHHNTEYHHTPTTGGAVPATYPAGTTGTGHTGVGHTGVGHNANVV